MIQRHLAPALRKLAAKMPVVSVTGPRQSGKSTLVRSVFADIESVNLENLEERQYAVEDPRGFLNDHPFPLIVDEAQYAPELFSYMQVACDETNRPGMYILTGSQNFLLLERVSQSLAGRVAILRLYPFSLGELSSTPHAPPDWDTCLWKGFYPRIYDRDLDPTRWYADYVQTYLERDVRQAVNVGDLQAFRLFLGACAGRVGTTVNLSSIGNDIGVSYQTAKRWMSVLEASYVLLVLRPYHRSFNKRVVKSPKIYFTDPGLAASLLGIRSKKDIAHHHSKGGLFETMVLMEVVKARAWGGMMPDLYFWRDSNGREVDCLMEEAGRLVAVEIKAGRTFNEGFLGGLRFLRSAAGDTVARSYVIYGGDTPQRRKEVRVLPWNRAAQIVR